MRARLSVRELRRSFHQAVRKGNYELLPFEMYLSGVRSNFVDVEIVEELRLRPNSLGIIRNGLNR